MAASSERVYVCVDIAQGQVENDKQCELERRAQHDARKQGLLFLVTLSSNIPFDRVYTKDTMLYDLNAQQPNIHLQTTYLSMAQSLQFCRSTRFSKVPVSGSMFRWKY